jgi:hypothetical protein
MNATYRRAAQSLLRNRFRFHRRIKGSNKIVNRRMVRTALKRLTQAELYSS